MPEFKENITSVRITKNIRNSFVEIAKVKSQELGFKLSWTQMINKVLNNYITDNKMDK